MDEPEPTIDVNVLYFAHFADLARRQTEIISLRRDAHVRDLTRLLAERDRRLSDLIGYGRASVNAEWATPETPLSNGDEVAFMPPMSGG